MPNTITQSKGRDRKQPSRWFSAPGICDSAEESRIIRTMSSANASGFTTIIHHRAALAARLPALTEYVQNSAASVALSRHPAWLNILHDSLGHEPFAIEAITSEGRTVGFLPLAFLDTFLFGKFLVSLPYLNTNGVVANTPAVQAELILRAVTLADELNARYLELRHEAPVAHPALTASMTHKVHMRLTLPRGEDTLWKGFDPKVRNQVRKGEKHSFTIAWGGTELLHSFYDVLTQNMRDLGSPFYGTGLFHTILTTFPENAELCVVTEKQKPIAAALLLHGRGVTEVPTASSLKEYNASSVNMLMYWHLLKRSVERGQRVFDFGRSTPDGGTFRFKKQWGAQPQPAVWQYHVNCGTVGEMRPDNPRYKLAIRLWRRLPVTITRLFGPKIIRGIP
jgi:FemAB-related protein (PEP-CTERM system-associated)